MISELDTRAREVFRHLVDLYISSGEPVGSRTLAQRLEAAGGEALSSASVRSVMAALEQAGLLFSPHTSAGRIPTETGLRLFVDGIMQFGTLDLQEREEIDSRCHASGRSMTEAMGEASSLLAGLSTCAGLVVAPRLDRPLKHIEFVPLSPGRALVVLVTEDGQVENRVIDIPLGVPSSSLVTASNFLSARLVGRTLNEVREIVLSEVQARRHELDELTQKVVAEGVGVWSGADDGLLIVRGQSRLLENFGAAGELEHLQELFAALETWETMERLLEETRDADGVKVFIGAQSGLFSQAGCSLIVAPLVHSGAESGAVGGGASDATTAANRSDRVVGAIGVIGPTRLNYGRIVPLVDYTAKVLGRVMSG